MPRCHRGVTHRCRGLWKTSPGVQETAGKGLLWYEILPRDVTAGVKSWHDRYVASKGKWQQGIVPRNFNWIIEGKLAVCERPGGYGANHRRVRRHEEILWLREQEFSWVVSLIGAPHNLHNYDELGVPWKHWPFNRHDDPAGFQRTHFPEISALLGSGDTLILHQEELGDNICGLMGAFLLWSGLVDTAPHAVTIIERMVQRQLGPFGRELVAIADQLKATT